MYLDKSGIGFTDREDKAYRGTLDMIETVFSMKTWLRADAEVVPVK